MLSSIVDEDDTRISKRSTMLDFHLSETGPFKESKHHLPKH